MRGKYINNLRFAIALIFSAFCSVLDGRAEDMGVDVPDSVASNMPGPSKAHNKSWITRIVDYFGKANVPRQDGKIDVSVIGGPHYSSDVKFGIGLVAAAHYGKIYTDSLTGRTINPNVALYGDFSITGFVMFGVRGIHIFTDDKSRLSYDGFFVHQPSKFWGIGFNSGKYIDNFTKYRRLSFRLNSTYSYRVIDNLFVGPTLDFAFFRAKSINKPKIWNSEPVAVTSLGFGGALMYDSRDNITAPNKGMLGEASLLYYPGFIGSHPTSFTMVNLSYSIYKRVWKSGILASRIHSSMTIGETPWCMMPTFGGSSSMRGYYEGRFIDKNEIDLTVELRQNIWHRCGAVVWVGAGTVFPRFSNLSFKKILPNAGIGYRWEFKRNSNVRIDLGFGRGETGFVFNINEAF